MLELTRRENVEAYLGQNVEVLEDILHKAAKQYAAVQKEKAGYDFGQRLTPEKLSSLAGEVIRDTKDFLEVTDTPPAYLSMFYLPRETKFGTKVALGVFTLGTLTQLLDGLNEFTAEKLQIPGLVALLAGGGMVLAGMQMHSRSHYESQRRAMRIGEKKEVEAAGVIAHEYTHHLQYSFTQLRGARNPIMEGHAAGVDGVISNMFAQRYDNPAYSFGHTEATTLFLKYAYLSACRKKGIAPKPSLAGLQTPKVGLLGNLGKYLSDHYITGIAAMSIAEALHGERVYRDVLKSDFSFLRVKQSDQPNDEN